MDNIIDIPASLTLCTSQISPTPTDLIASNAIGYWNDGRQTFGFYVKMRNLLGNLYDKYDKFVISLVQADLVNSVANSATVSVQLQMGGLNFVNSSYDQVSQANSYWTVLANTSIPTGATSASILTYDILSNTFIFRKGDADVRIDFRFMNLLTNQPATVSSGIFPTVCLIFKIMPLKE